MTLDMFAGVLKLVKIFVCPKKVETNFGIKFGLGKSKWILNVKWHLRNYCISIILRMIKNLHRHLSPGGL